MKKYLSGSWMVIKNYLFAMIFFCIFFVGFYSKVSLFSIAIFIIMIMLIYSESAHYAGVDKRRYGSIRPYEGAVYGLLATVPFIVIQIIISQLNLSFEAINFDALKINLIKGFVAPMLFVAKLGKYTIWGFMMAWSTIVLFSFLGYFAGYKGFELTVIIRRFFGLQPKKKRTTNRNRR